MLFAYVYIFSYIFQRLDFKIFVGNMYDPYIIVLDNTTVAASTS